VSAHGRVGHEKTIRNYRDDGSVTRNSHLGSMWEGNMKFPHRRRFLHLAAAAATVSAVSRTARAQAYPSRPVRVILGYAAGGAPDIVARLMGRWLSERLGQQFIIDNRPGAGSNIGTEAAARASPDGYTILYVTTANAITPSVFQKLNFNFIRDIAPVAGIIRIPNLVSVNPSLPIKTIPQLIADAQANPGKLNFGAPTATTPQLSGELFSMMTGVNIVHVAYRNQTQAVTDQIAGQIQIGFDAMPTTLEHTRAGKLRALAVTTATRSPALPDVPSVGDFVPGYEASSWHGIGVPKNTPSEITTKLNEEINAALADPKMQARLADLGGMVLAGSPDDFGKLIADETEKWAKVVKFAGIKAE
jgi:tripartite-type tricarboxylate transporter receptor subunit TctC